MDLIFALTQWIKRAKEYRLPLRLVFVDRTFDSVEIQQSSLKMKEIKTLYIKMFEAMDVFTNLSARAGCDTRSIF